MRRGNQESGPKEGESEVAINGVGWRSGGLLPGNRKRAAVNYRMPAQRIMKADWSTYLATTIFRVWTKSPAVILER
jgi:hypothetical protein